MLACIDLLTKSKSYGFIVAFAIPIPEIHYSMIREAGDDEISDAETALPTMMEYTSHYDYS